MQHSLFRKNLHKLYRQIDKSSNLLWSHENHITGGKKSARKKAELSWVNLETTQTGYGEISMGSMTGLMNLYQNCSILIEDEISKKNLDKKKLKYPPKDYNMNNNSFFLDIGSGFGKPVFHSAFQVGCKSVGIEVVPARVEFCWDFYYEFLDGKNFFGNKEDFDEEKLLDTNKSETSNEQSNDPDSNFNILSKIYNKKISVDFNSFKFDFASYIDFFLKDSQGSEESHVKVFDDYCLDITEIKKNYECYQSSNSSLCYDDNYVRYVSSHYPRPLLVLEEIRTRFNKSFNYFHKITFSSNQKVTSQLSSIIKNNILLDLSLSVSSYTSFPCLTNYPDNLPLVELLYYVNICLTTIIPENSECHIKSLEISCDLAKKEEAYSQPKEKKDLVHYVLNKFTTSTDFDQLFYKKVLFECKDATADQKFTTSEGDHYTHIYSYNKLMSDSCRKKIAKILNKTNWKILVWYSNEVQTKKCGLKKYFFIAKFPMCSTSTEKFYCYVYIKIK